jgi:transcription-repair coupling factor (superfamily II helicase)
MRLVHYKRIANCRSVLELDSLQIELIDRFGLLPPPLKTLFAITALKLLAEQLGLAKIQAGDKGGSITFGERSHVDPTRLLKLIESDAKRYRLDGPYKLRFSWTLESPEKRIAALDKLLRRLGAEDSAAAAA